MVQESTVKWGIVGCGDVVETKSGPATYLAEGSELVGMWNRTRAKAEEWTARHEHGRVFDSLEELLACPEIDIVYVATTPDCHRDQALAVAAAGKHCYLEKPIALSYAEAVEIRDAFAAAGKRCFVAHYRRGMPRYIEAKRLIDAGVLGKVRGVQVIRTQRQTAEELLPYEQKPWRVRPEVSGGAHFYEGDAHMLDLIDFLVGLLTDVKLVTTNETGAYPAADAVTLAGFTQNHVMVSATWCYATYKAIDRFLIYGDEGSLEFPYYDNAAPMRLETVAGGAASQVAHEGVMGGVRKGPELEVREVAPEPDSIVGLGLMQQAVDELRGVSGVACASTLDSAMRTLAITDAAERQWSDLRAHPAYA